MAGPVEHSPPSCLDAVLAVLRLPEAALRSSADLSEALAFTRQDVNAALYSLEEEGLVRRDAGAPPLWRAEASALARAPRPGGLAGEGGVGDAVAELVVFVDLGNVHDCLQPLLPYARRGLLTIRAYADRTFRGFGVNPSLERELGCRVIQAAGAHRNAADSILVWDMAILCERARLASRRLRFLVASKDQGFLAVADLARASGGHEVVFCQDWRDLRVHVE